MKALQRREREIARTREDIIEAASRAFVERGLHETTMQDIAREAGYTAASLYTYFRSKQEIIEAVGDMLTAEFLSVFDEPMPSNLSFAQRFELLVTRHLALIDKRRALIVSFHTGEGGQGCEGHTHGQTFHENFERRIAGVADWFKQNAKPEDLGGHPPELAARVLVGMGFGLLHESFPHGGGRLASHASLLTEIFFRGISGPPKVGAKRK